MDAAEIPEGDMQSDSGFQVRQLLAEGIPKAASRILQVRDKPAPASAYSAFNEGPVRTIGPFSLRPN
jgi:hypothetical protein